MSVYFLARLYFHNFENQIFTQRRARIIKINLWLQLILAIVIAKQAAQAECLKVIDELNASLNNDGTDGTDNEWLTDADDLVIRHIAGAN